MFFEGYRFSAYVICFYPQNATIIWRLSIPILHDTVYHCASKCACADREDMN